MKPFATLEDLLEHWPGLPDDLHDSAEHKLFEASVIIRSLYPDVDRRLEQGKLSADTVTYIVCDMVATAIRRVLEAEKGDNLQSQTFSAGPYSQTLAYRVREATLFLSKLHRQMLSGGGSRNRKAFTILPKP